MIVTQHQPQRVDVTVYGEFTLADFKEFEAMVGDTVRVDGSVDLLFDLRQMADFTLDVAWEDIVFARAHANDFRRIAVLTHSQWVAWSAWLSQIFVQAQMQGQDVRLLKNFVTCAGHLKPIKHRTLSAGCAAPDQHPHAKCLAITGHQLAYSPISPNTKRAAFEYGTQAKIGRHATGFES